MKNKSRHPKICLHMCFLHRSPHLKGKKMIFECCVYGSFCSFCKMLIFFRDLQPGTCVFRNQTGSCNNKTLLFLLPGSNFKTKEEFAQKTQKCAAMLDMGLASNKFFIWIIKKMLSALTGFLNNVWYDSIPNFRISTNKARI